MSYQEAEAIERIKECLIDLADPTRQSLRRKRRTVRWLAHCAAELEHMVASTAMQGHGGSRAERNESNCDTGGGSKCLE
jgi:hypothetical protein